MRRARPDWAAGSRAQRRRRTGRGRHARARPPPPRGRSDALRSRHSAGRGLMPARSRTLHLDWPRMLAEPALASPRPRSTRAYRAVHARLRPARRRPRPRLQALDRRAASSSPASRRSSSPATWDAEAVLELEPRRGADRQRPRRPGAARRPDRDRERAARARAALRDLPRPSARSDWHSAWRRSSSRSATAAPTTPSASPGPSRVLVTAQNHGFAVAPGDAAEVSHVSLNDGTVEGLARRRLRDTSSSTQRPRRARTTPSPSSTGSPRRAERTDLRSILIVGSGPIRIGQGCEFDYAGVPGLPRAERRGLPGRARELEPGDDHDRPGVGRRHLPRAARRARRSPRSSPASSRTRSSPPSAARRR